MESGLRFAAIDIGSNAMRLLFTRVIEKKNEIQTKGDIFARDYSLKSARRDKKA